MIITVYGGSANGKSEYAEDLASSLSENPIYIATMLPGGTEAAERIEKHNRQRHGKNFIIKEHFLGLKSIRLPFGCTVLLECVSNLLANEMFTESGAESKSIIAVMDGIKRIIKISRHLIIVSNNVFEDGQKYDEATNKYISNLAKINEELMKISDVFIEIVCGLPVFFKGNLNENLD
ncbi:MAG: bifunctional adenosylcobinamide kinase/adenosylcobinamide-phosphate guanylyltransferase [Eubacterium sp.]|jgi:adenosylcobinamide kinase/adenosylcobinamide-phosphate guanylyltransferase|nr:bifunctional adenosylcobinamide kinase/adenosylcobinamide-phosphate guanylyltransferase [Eubacterium sp.]